MNRRSFLRAILAAGIAPYVVTTAGVLMPVRPLWTPPALLHGELGTVEGVLFRVTLVGAGGASRNFSPRLVPGNKFGSLMKFVPGRECSFTIVGNPGLAVGDLIRISDDRFAP